MGVILGVEVRELELMRSRNGKVKILAKYPTWMLQFGRVMVGFGMESKSVSFNKYEGWGLEGQQITASRLLFLKCLSDLVGI